MIPYLILYLNVTSYMNYFFALQYEEEHSDVWGLSKPSAKSKGLYINYFDNQWGSPSWDPPKPDKLIQVEAGYESTQFQLLVERPVVVVSKSVPTVLDGCLKVGGLLGFMKIFSALMGVVHQRLFVKELEEGLKHKKIDEDDESANNRLTKERDSKMFLLHDNIQSTIEDSESGNNKKPIDIEDVYSFKGIKDTYQRQIQQKVEISELKRKVDQAEMKASEIVELRIQTEVDKRVKELKQENEQLIRRMFQQIQSGGNHID